MKMKEDNNASALVKTKDEISAVERLVREAQDAIILCNRLSRSLFLSCAGNVVLSILLIIAVIAAINTETKYAATSPDGKLTPLTLLDRPLMSDNGVKNFTRDTLYDVLNLDFDKYREQLEKGREGFTDAGLANLISAVKDAGIIDIMTKERVNTRTEFSTSIISKKGIENNGQMWVIQIPITISFVGQNTITKPMAFYLIATVVAADLKNHPKGVAISQVVTLPRK